MTDLIRRQAALEVLDEYAEDIESGDFGIAYSKARMSMCNIPSVEPKRNMGKWEYIQYDGNPKIGNWHCSECRLIVNLGFEGEPYYHYCPSCGAKMRG